MGQGRPSRRDQQRPVLQCSGELGIKTEWTWVKTSGPEARTTPTEVYQFKITLLDTQPPIWRRIQVSDCTLDRLNAYIQIAMGWTNSHMRHFRIDGKLYGDPMLSEGTFGELQYEDSTTTRLSDILPVKGGQFRFEYEYDFGDGWLHDVLFEARLPADPKTRYPRCLEGERACPPEDVGGVWGYADFLEAIKNPKHEAHEDMKEWIGGRFDPEKFSVAKVNTQLKMPF